MTQIVVDASVVVKWVLPHLDDEEDTKQALDLLAAVKAGRVTLIQPPHWLAEVAAVLVRLAPESVQDDLRDLYAMAIPVADEPEVYWRACELAQSLHHHLFDTLYHAVALVMPDTLLVTADDRYERKARGDGSIVLLKVMPPV